MKEKFEIIDHGYDHAQYFPGCGTAWSDFEEVVTGCGGNAKEAYEEVVESIYQHLGNDADRLHLPKRPHGIRKRDKVPASLFKGESEFWWYVSIRYNPPPKKNTKGQKNRLTLI